MLDITKQQNMLMSRLIEGENIDVIEQERNRLDREKTIYDQLTIQFPGYIGQIFFFSYKAFFQEPIRKGGQEAFEQYVQYLDRLPSFELMEYEKEEIEKLTTEFDVETFMELNQEKWRRRIRLRSGSSKTKKTLMLMKHLLKVKFTVTAPSNGCVTN